MRRRISSWYAKAKDSAIGSSFDQHVVGGYRFLMRFYSMGDEIYIFGFSRGVGTSSRIILQHAVLMIMSGLHSPLLG
jgi:uncharacterized protein (DUF2235 family)